MKLARPKYFFFDPELRIIHIERSCPEAKTATKYGYLEEVRVTDQDEARALDRRGRPCPRCKKIAERKKSGGKQFRYKRGNRPE